MHIISLPSGIQEDIPIAQGRSLSPGQSYIATNRFAGSMLLSPWRVMLGEEMHPLRTLLEVRPYAEDYFFPESDWNNCDIWLYRGGGYGDLLLLTPLIKEMKRRWPKARINVACGTAYFDLFKGLDVHCEPIPLPTNLLGPLISFEETVESDPMAEKLHMAQLFASKAGITLTDLKPFYQVTEGEKSFAEREYPRTGKSRIAVQFMASALYRSYPHIQKVILELSKIGEVFIFGNPGQLQLNENLENVTNLMERGFDFRESAAILATCDACVAPDSSLVHLCSALDVPCVALYGPFPSALRLTSDKAIGLDGRAPCSPCFYHAERSTDFPAKMPCEKVGRCVALENIPVDDVVDAVMKLVTDRA